MVLFRGRTNVGITDAAILFDGVLTVIIFIVFGRGAVAAVLIFSSAAAIVASAIASMLAGRVIFPITIGIRAVGRAPVNNLAAVPANFFPITSIPRRIGIVVLAGRIFFVAAFGTNTARVEAMGLRVAIRILVCAAIRTALPDVMLGFILLLIIVGEAARRAVTARNAASAGGNHKNGVCRDKGDAFCVKNAHRDLIAGYDFECRHIYARKCSIRNVKTIVVVVQLQPVQICAILERIRAKVCKRGQNARFQVCATGKPKCDIRHDHVRAGIKFYAWLGRCALAEGAARNAGGGSARGGNGARAQDGGALCTCTADDGGEGDGERAEQRVSDLAGRSIRQTALARQTRASARGFVRDRQGAGEDRRV